MMKKNNLIRFVLLLLIFNSACKKETIIVPDNSVYEQTINDIKREEPILLTFSNSNNSIKVIWTISPTSVTAINAVGNTATVTFSKRGTYTVTGTSGNAIAKYIVKVTGTVYNPYGTNFSLSASRLININAGDPVVFTIHNPSARRIITWSVFSTSYNIRIDTINLTATVTFNKGGYGSVTASDGIHTERRTVWINDNANTNPNEDTVSFILGDKLLLQPSIQVVGANKQLVISTTTINSYHCATDKILSFSEGSSYMIDYAGVAIAPQPCSANNKASCSNRFTNIQVGNHPFVINYENKTFAGNINVSNTGIYTFTWPNNSAINISPLVVQ